MATRQERKAQFAPQLPRLLAMMGLGLLVIGLALVAGASAESRETRILENEGIQTSALVLETRTREMPSGQKADVHSDVRFTTTAGETVDETVTDCGSRQPDAPGSQIEVVYAPSDPSLVQFVDLACRKVSDATGFVIAGTAALVLAPIPFYFAWRKRKELGAASVSSQA